MQAGQLRHRVTIQQASESQNSVGEAVKSWASVATVWARVNPLRGTEYLAAMQAKATVDTRITMRKNAFPGLTPKHRIVFGARVFDIEAVIDVDGLGDAMEVSCKEQA